MTKTTKIVWRLREQPTAENLRELVKDKILTNEEARQILFSSEEVENRDIKSLEAEVKFLRELVDKLSQSKQEIVRYVEQVKPIYIKDPWYQPYMTWTCSNGTSFNSIITF